MQRENPKKNGAEGSRTPVRKGSDKNLYERSFCFNFTRDNPEAKINPALSDVKS